MLSKLDQCIGDVVAALKERSMLNNSIIIFSTDNGGPAAGFNLNAASNWPLRGVKVLT
jgi:arylsulfatase A-like enzyme